MKKLILLSIVLFSTSTFSQELRPDGRFQFTEVTTVQVRDVEIVPESNRDRYRALLEDNYQCELITEFFKCVKHLKDAELPLVLRQQIENLWLSKSIVFTLSPLSPALTNDAESLSEWKVFDKVTFSGKQVFEYDYLLLKGENSIHKIAIRFPPEDMWAILENKKTLYLPVSKIVNTGRFNSRVYELALYFNRH